MIDYISPDELGNNPAYSQAVTTQGPGKTIYIGGQNAVNAKQELIGKGDIQAQTVQVMQRIQIALSAGGATFDNLVKLSIHVLQGQDIQLAYKAAQPFLSQSAHPPIVTVLFVSGFGSPDFLLEVDAIAFVPDEKKPDMDMIRSARQYSPATDPDTGGEDILNPEADAELGHDLYDDETAYRERGEIRKGIFEEDDRHESPLKTDTQAGENENVAPGA